MKKIPFKYTHLIPCAVFIAAKLWYKTAATGQLDFLLLPVAKIISIITNVDYKHTESGYYFNDLQIIIDKSCAGFNLLLIYFMLFSWAMIMRFSSIKTMAISLITSIFLAYAATVMSNTCRIYGLLILQKPLTHLFTMQPSMIHEGFGIINNITFLILSYALLNHFLKSPQHEKLA